MAYRLTFYCYLQQRSLSTDTNRHTVLTHFDDQIQDREP